SPSILHQNKIEDRTKVTLNPTHRFKIIDLNLVIEFIEMNCRCECGNRLKFIHEGRHYHDYGCSNCKNIVRWHHSRRIKKHYEVDCKLACAASLSGIDNIEFQRYDQQISYIIGSQH